MELNSRVLKIVGSYTHRKHLERNTNFKDYEKKKMKFQHPEEDLFDHTVSIRDIELLADFYFFTDRTIWPLDVATFLRTTINEELRQLDHI